MAGLPPDGEWLIQQVGGVVIVFQRDTEYEVARWDVNDVDATQKAQQVIHESKVLTAEQKCFAHFWAGYFYANAKGV